MMQELKGLTFKQVKHVREVVQSLPTTLDGMYDRMLSRIQSRFQTEALSLIRWLAYSERPLSLNELIEALRINPDEDGIINSNISASEKEILNLLGGLMVTIHIPGDDTMSVTTELDSTNGVYGSSEDGESEAIYGKSEDSGGFVSYESSESNKEETGPIFSANFSTSDCQLEGEYLAIDQVKPGESREVRLAHFSIKEYLESERILDSCSKRFHLEPGREQKYLTYYCLSYLTAYANQRHKRSSKECLVKFPLLHYAATTWDQHAHLQEETDGYREATFLASAFIINSLFSLEELVDREMDVWRGPTGSRPMNTVCFTQFVLAATMLQRSL